MRRQTDWASPSCLITHARRHIDAGKLVRVFRDWRSKDGIVHIVFTTRRGLPPAVRALIDHLAREFPDL